MPDYQLVIAGTGVGIADTFEIMVIATPKPTSVSDTFLAARTLADEAALRRALTGDRPPRVAWSKIAGGTLGRRLDPRLARVKDPRILLIPTAGWFLLTRPELVFEVLDPAHTGRPAWLDQLVHIEEQTGLDVGPIAVLVLADLGVPMIAVPGLLPPVPTPQRLTLAITVDPKGLIVTGAAVYDDAAQARAFHDALGRARTDALGSLAMRFVLSQLGVDGAVSRLALRLEGGFVTFSTSLTNAEAVKVLARAAQMSRQYFLRVR